MMFNEVTVVFPENLTELINIVHCAQNAKTVEVKSDDLVTTVL